MSMFAEILQEEMDARGWSEDEVARRMGPEIGPGENSCLIGLCLYVDEANLDPYTATKLALAFGTSAQFWLNLWVGTRGTP